MTDYDFIKSELAGRLPVIYKLQLEHPESAVISMPLKSHYDLEQIIPGEQPKYIEVKRRNCTSDAYPTVMFNEEKVEDNSTYADNFYYCATYTDNKAIWFQPATMPESGVTVEYKEIKKTFIDPNSPKIRQKRLFYNLNDKYAEETLPEIIIKNEEDDVR